MKRVAILVTVVGVIAGGSYLMSSEEMVYVAPEVVVEEKVVEKVVPELDKRFAEAISASSTAIQQAMDAAAEDAKKAMESEIKLQVINQMKLELNELEEQEEAKTVL